MTIIKNKLIISLGQSDLIKAVNNIVKSLISKIVSSNSTDDEIPTAKTVYDAIGKRVMANTYSVPDTGQTVSQVLESAGLNVSGGYACAYIRNTSYISDRPFSDNGAIYAEVIARDSGTKILRWTDWMATVTYQRSQTNNSWNNWYPVGVQKSITLTADASIVNSIGTSQAWRIGNVVFVNVNVKFATTTQGNIFTGLPKARTEAWGMLTNGAAGIEISIASGGTALVKRSNGTAAWYKGMFIYETE